MASGCLSELREGEKELELLGELLEGGSAGKLIVSLLEDSSWGGGGKRRE